MRKPHGIVYPRKGNPWWPRPVDYREHYPGEKRATLSAEGRRLARINACRMQQTPELAAQAWHFFCREYLLPWQTDDGGEYNPCFYEMWVPPAAIHFQMIRWFESYPRSAIGFPRGGAKSTTLTSYVLWKLMTNEQWLANIYLSKYKPLVLRTSDKIRTQIAENPRLRDDFGDLVPKRGRSGAWSTDYFRLKNFSSVALFSIDGKLRGPRSMFSLVDDIEQDPDGDKIPTAEEIEEVKNKILRVLIPMLREGCHLAITGTLFHQRCLLNQILTNTDPESPDYDDVFAGVEQGGLWHKVKFGWCDSEGKSLWPGVFTEKFISEMLRSLGPARFASEFENNPISLSAALFTVDPKKHGYHLDSIDYEARSHPFESGSRAVWHETSGTRPLTIKKRETPWKKRVTELVRGITIDPIRRASATSDFAAMVVGGLDERGDMWLLDLWADKKDNIDVCQELWKLVIKWRPQVIGVEDTGFSDEYFHQSDQMRELLLDQIGYIPQCVPIKPPSNMSKGQRIKRLAFRYAWGKIKYPLDLLRVQPWAMLVDQTLRFTEDLANLRHDDLLDATEMLQTLLKGQKAVAVPVPTSRTAAERFIDGERTIEGTDIPMLQTCDLHSMTPDQLAKVMQEARDRVQDDLDYEYGYEETDVVDMY